MQDITFRSQSFFDDLVDQSDPHVHLILIATKPDIIKQIPLYRELKKRGHTTVLGHTGQHYDENLSGGMLKEFSVEPDFNLNVKGSVHEVVSQIIGRLGDVIEEIKKREKIVIPYVHGDTTTAMAASNAGFCHRFSSVHVEAGIRTLTPQYEMFSPTFVATMKKDGSPDKWREFLMCEQDAWNAHWERGSQEPYPEQFNTRCSEAATGIHLAPVELDKAFMIGEGFCEDRLFVTGNSVVDATQSSLTEIEESSVFDRHPLLKEGNFVRFCIHRRENCLSEKRFRAIYGALQSLVQEKRTVLLINMHQTKAAFERFGLKEDVEELHKNHENFILTDVWPEYRDVVAAMSKASVCATDSGSMQEEMNELSVPCVTLRFGSDRSEAAMIGGNLIAPPIDANVIRSLILYAWDSEEMRTAKKIYGNDVSSKCIDEVENVLKQGEVFRDEEKRLHSLCTYK